MSATINIIETTTELGLEVVEVVVASTSTPGPAGPGVPAGGTLNQVLTKQSATDFDTDWEDAQGGGGGAPDDADYLVGTAHGDLSAEIVVGATPGGELGGTWASPTVDAMHSGSTHAAVQAAAEATAAAALSVHTADTTAVHGIADTSALALTANHPSNATFNDHSARHENGGADEISIAGLDGTPAELTNHLADATDAHDASAISVVPFGSIAATQVQAALEEIVAEAGGGSGEALQRDIAQAGHGLAVGNVVRLSGSTWQKAQANSAVNAEAIGIVAAVADVDNFTLHYGGRITGLSGLTAGSVYYLDDDTSGLLTTTEPPDAGDVSKPLLVADTTTTGYFFNWRGAVVVDMATQAELDAHVNDTTDAHDATAISFAPAGTIAATTVQAAIEEVASEAGGSIDQIFEVFGAPDTAFEFSTSSLTGLTALSPATDVADSDTTIPGHFYLEDDTTSLAYVGRYATAPATPWTAITKVGHNVRNANMVVGMFIGVATPGAMNIISLGQSSIKTQALVSPTSFSGDIGTAIPYQTQPTYCLIRANSSTSFDFMVSMDGYTWIPITLARNPVLTIAVVGMGLFAQDAGGCSAAYDFLRIWNSAKAIPGFP